VCAPSELPVWFAPPPQFSRPSSCGVVSLSHSHQGNLMNPKHFHTPVSTRVRCPVCHEAVYSRAGIHPQCAVRQSDPPRSKSKPPVAPGDGSHVAGNLDPLATEIVVDPPAAD